MRSPGLRRNQDDTHATCCERKDALAQLVRQRFPRVERADNGEPVAKRIQPLALREIGKLNLQQPESRRHLFLWIKYPDGLLAREQRKFLQEVRWINRDNSLSECLVRF